MAKDKDDPDLSPTTWAGKSGGQADQAPPFSNTSSNDKHPTAKGEPVPAPKAMTGGDDDHKDAPSPSSSDANTPNTLSTEEQPKTQPQSDDELFNQPQTADETSTRAKEDTSWALITDPDSGTSHPNLDLTDRNTLTRLLALLQNGWALSHGRGPRQHDQCLWCRGPIESDIDILTHVGKTNSCRNSWPASCLMDWIHQELDSAKGCASGYRLKCPMCSEEFCNFTKKSGTDFKAFQGKADSESVMNAAWLRCVLFSPAFAREACLAQGKQLIFMKGSEAKKLIFLGKEKVIFYQCEGLLDPVESENKRRWLKRQYGDNLPYTIEQLTQMGIAQSEATAINYAYNQAATNTSNPSCTDEPLELEPRFDTTWVIIDRGNNQFIMSPFLTEKANPWIRAPAEISNFIIKDMTAEEFNVLAKANGGLLAAVQGFEAGMEEDIKRHRVSAEQWLQHVLAKYKPFDVAGPTYEFWKRVKDAYDVKLNFKLGADEGTNDDDEEWEDEDD